MLFSNRGSLACAVVVQLLVLGVEVTEGQDVAGSFEQLRSQVSIGDDVTVTDVTGREVRGTITELSSSSLALVVGTTQMEFLEADVETVSLRDSRWNGTCWGLGAGVVLGVLLDRSLVAEYGRDDISGGSSVALIAAAAGMGAGAGFAVDAMIGRRRIIYTKASSPTKSATVLPVWSGRRKGLFVSLRF